MLKIVIGLADSRSSHELLMEIVIFLVEVKVDFESFFLYLICYWVEVEGGIE